MAVCCAMCPQHPNCCAPSTPPSLGGCLPAQPRHPGLWRPAQAGDVPGGGLPQCARPPAHSRRVRCVPGACCCSCLRMGCLARAPVGECHAGSTAPSPSTSGVSLFTVAFFGGGTREGSQIAATFGKLTQHLRDLIAHRWAYGAGEPLLLAACSLLRITASWGKVPGRASNQLRLAPCLRAC